MDAAKEADIKTLYWSGLEPVSKISAGKYTEVKHFDTKVRTLPSSGFAVNRTKLIGLEIRPVAG